MRQGTCWPHLAGLCVTVVVTGLSLPRGGASPAGASAGTFAAAWWLLEEEAGARLETRPRFAAATARVLMARLRTELIGAGSAAPDDRARLRAWHRVIFGRWRFSALPARGSPPPTAVQLAAVLTQRRGSCLGLGALYLALGEELGLPLRGVLVPGHFFVRLQARKGRPARNVELLAAGRARSDAWYRRRYHVPPDHPLYLRSLSAAESLAVLRYELANALRRAGALQAARAHYALVVAQLPEFAEAQSNLGLTQQLLGDRAAAARSYRRALHAGAPAAGINGNLRRLVGGPARR